VLAAGAALLAASFVPLWATYRISGLDIVAPEVAHRNAWDAYGLGMQVGLSLAAGAAAVAAVGMLGRDHPWERPLLLALCSAVTVLLVWQVADGPQGSPRPNGYGIDRGVLAFAGPLLGACMTYGATLVRRKPARGPRVGDDVPRAPGRAPRGE
jgi:hypothetical protein